MADVRERMHQDEVYFFHEALTTQILHPAFDDDFAGAAHAVAQAIELQEGEIVEWLIDDYQNLVLKRSDQAVSSLKKKLPARKKS